MEKCGKCRKVTSLPENRFHDFTVGFGPSIMIVLGLLAYLTPFAFSAAFPFNGRYTPKRTAYPSVTDMSLGDGYPVYQSGVRYDEYPIVVPKRTALILDRIFKEIEAAKYNNRLINDWSPISRRAKQTSPNKDKVYYKCYFNAVSCYRRK